MWLKMRELLRRLRISELLGIEIRDAELYPMFHFNLPDLVQERLPETVLRKIIGHTF